MNLSLNTKILVTGSSGFIAARVCEMLLEKGEQVVGLDNMNDYYDVRLKQFRLEKLLKYPNFIFYKADIENFNELKEIFQNHSFKVVYNLAARAGVRYSLENPWIYLRTNTEGTLNLLELIKDFSIKKYIMASTSSLYAGLPIPFKEDLPVNTPISPYAASKKAAEMLAYTYHKQYGIDVSILRYFTVYGPLGRPDMAPFRFIKWIMEGIPITIYGNGTQTRDFTYIDDIAKGTILAEKKLGYEIINLGGGKIPVSINQFIQTIEQEVGKKAIINFLPPNKADMSETMANIEKAKEILNWFPETGINQGIKEILKQKELLYFNV